MHVTFDPFTCDICDLKFSRKDNLYAHRRTIHNSHFINFDALRESQKSSKSCKMCDETFEDLDNEEAHIVSKVCRDKLKKLNIDSDEKSTVA